MIKNKRRALLVVAASMIFTSTLNNISYANTTNENKSPSGVNTKGWSTSIIIPKTVSGIKYSGFTQIQTLLSQKAAASTIVSTDKSAPSGRIGVHTALYREGTGNAIVSSAWKYNSRSTTVHEITVSASATKGKNYRARGTMKCYNTSTGSYVGVSLNATPYIPASLSEKEMLDQEYLSYKNMNLTISDEELQERINMYEIRGMIAAKA